MVNLRNRRKKRTAPDMSESVPVKNHYFRRFFYAFSVCFIVFGLIGIVWFVYSQDPNAFGASEKYLARGEEALAQSDLTTALEYFEKCLEQDPKESKARLRAVEIYRAQGNYRMAEKLLNDGLSLQPRYEEYYRQMVYLLTEQNRVAEALAYLDGITATYIVVKLNEERPASLSASPQPGVFSQAVNVSLKVPENATVYYTTDGSAPDRNSRVYTPGTTIRVEKGTVNLRAVAINDAGMPSEEYDVSYRVYNEKTEYQFKDAKIERLVRLILNRSGGTVYYKDLESVTTIDCVAGALSGVTGSVTTLDDLLEMPNLSTLNLDGEKNIASLEPLRRLGQLRSLSLNGCGLTDAHASGLSMLQWLTSLSLADNQFTSLSFVESMVLLQSLNVSSNNIQKVPSLTRLSSLKNLDVSGNMINTVSWISGHQAVEMLNIGQNQISDISNLSSCVALKDLNVSYNPISSLAVLAACSRLETLDVSGTDITTLTDVQGLTRLRNLSVAYTKVTSLEPLQYIFSITSLNVSGTAVSDFRCLGGSSLKNLYASGCGLESLESMSSLGLSILDVSNNSLTDIQPLIWLSELSILDISKNSGITDFIHLLNCSKLSSVNCKETFIPESVSSALIANRVSVIQ